MEPLQTIWENSIWRHTSGDLYEVILFTNVEGTKDKYPTTIVYQNVVNKKYYSRRADDWFRSMTLVTKNKLNA